MPVAADRINDAFVPLLEKVQAELADAGFDREDTEIVRSVAMKYRYQVHELTIPFPPGSDLLTGRGPQVVVPAFDDTYEEMYGKGSAYRAAGQEIATIRVRGIGLLPKPRIESISARGTRPHRSSRQMGPGRGSGTCTSKSGRGSSRPTFMITAKLNAGAMIEGPAVIETPITTVVVNPGDRAVLDEYANLRITIAAQPG